MRLFQAKVVDIQEKQEWTKDRTLRHSTLNSFIRGTCIIILNKLQSIGKVTFHPCKRHSSDAIMPKFIKQNFMVYRIKYLRKIQKNSNRIADVIFRTNALKAVFHQAKFFDRTKIYIVQIQNISDQFHPSACKGPFTRYDQLYTIVILTNENEC